MDPICVVDIGGSKAACVIVDCELEGAPRVVGVGNAPCAGTKKGCLVDIDDTARSVVNAVRSAEAMAEHKVTRVITSISGDHLVGQEGRGIIPIVPPGRPITREDVNRVINHSKQIAIPADRELIHAIPKSFRVDGQEGIARPIGMSGERLEVRTYLVSGLSSQVQNIERCFHQIQIEIDHLVVSAVASASAVLSSQEMELGAAAADIGGNVTEVAVYKDGGVARTFVVPIGSAHITSDVSKLLKTSIEEAERLKLTYGGCDHAAVDEKEAIQVLQIGTDKPRAFSRRVFTEIIEARARELLGLVKNGLSEKGLLQNLGSGLVLTGGGSKLQGIARLAGNVMPDTPARIGRPSSLAGLSDMVEGEQFASTVGLIKYGIRVREDEAVAAEAGSIKGIISKLGSLFGSKQKSES